MISYFGDFAEDDTVLIPFNTFDSNDPSASVTVTDLADADINVHKDGSTTQIVTDGATVAINFDSITGNHLVTIDTSAHADYSTGSEYAVRLEGITVDGATLNAWIGAFSIERAGGVLALLKGTNSLANIEDKIDIIDTNVDQIETAVITNAAGADVSADILVIDNFVDGLESTIGAAGDGLTAIPWNAAWDAEVESEVNDALDTAIAELGVAAPTATPTIRTGLMLLYMSLRNKTVVQTSGTDALEIYNNAGTKIAAKLLTDDGSDYTEAEMA